MPANPELSYGWAKFIGEKRIEYALEQGTRTKVSIARIIGAYGPGQDFDLETGSAIPVFIRRAIEYPDRSPFVVFGTGRETRSYCFVHDIVDGIMKSVAKLNEESFFGPFNLGSSHRVSIGEIARAVIEISKKDIEISFDDSTDTLIWGQELDCTRANSILGGWWAGVTLTEGLKMCYQDIEERLAIELQSQQKRRRELG